MTLVLTFLAAIIVTVLRWKLPQHKCRNLSLLCTMFWGASIMWIVDEAFVFAEAPGEYFTNFFAEAADDSLLGISVIALALCIWAISLLRAKYIAAKAS